MSYRANITCLLLIYLLWDPVTGVMALADVAVHTGGPASTTPLASVREGDRAQNFAAHSPSCFKNISNTLSRHSEDPVCAPEAFASALKKALRHHSL